MIKHVGKRPLSSTSSGIHHRSIRAEMLDSPSLHCRFTTTWPSLLLPLPLPHSFHNNSLLLPTSCNPNSTKFHSPHFNSSLVHGPGRMAFPVLALNKSGKGGIRLNEQGDSDIEFDEDDFEDEDEDEDEDEMLLPLKNMRERRPRGFGQGKEYDTSIEDELLQEIEKSRAAQAANISKLKNQSSSEPDSGRNVARIEAPEIVSTGARVRIVNLPRKKNIHRDLMVAFKEFPGIINITPAVLGNKKTRDPICKGFAFVDCKSKGDAISFLQAFSGRHLTFGRVQKEIKCEIIHRQTSSSSQEISVGSTNHSRLTILQEEAEQVADLDMDLAGEVIRTKVEDIEENLASDSELHSDDEDGNGAESISDSKIRSATQKELEKIDELEEILPQRTEEVRREIPPIKGKTKVSKKKKPKEKGEKKSLIGIPGSAKRLRIKEKAVLTDVYSRYGNKPALVSKEGN